MQGRSPAAIRIMATSGPERRAQAILAVNAMAPNMVAAITIVKSARWVAFFATVNGMRLHYRGAGRDDAPTIIEFQEAMARETEDVALERDVITRGVHAVFDDPSRGRYYVAVADGVVVASLLITYE